MSTTPLNITFDADDFARFGQEFAIFKYEIQEAIRAAVKATTNRIHEETLRGFVKVSGLRVMLIRRRLFLRYRYEAGFGRVWLGLNPISLSKLNPRKVAGGVKAGPVFVRGGFMPGGKYGKTVFRRVGPERSPIEKQVYDLKDIGEEMIRTRVEPIVHGIFQEEFEDSMVSVISGNERRHRRTTKRFATA